jgi:hypothetical protein
MQPDEIPRSPERVQPPRRPRLLGGRRFLATSLLAIGLVAMGGVATVMAASPSPSGSPSASTGASASQAPTHSCPARPAASPSGSSS